MKRPFYSRFEPVGTPATAAGVFIAWNWPSFSSVRESMEREAGV